METHADIGEEDKQEAIIEETGSLTLLNLAFVLFVVACVLLATDKIATDLQRQDIYDDTFLNENGFNYLFGAVTCPVVAMVLVAGMFVSIVLGVVAHMVLETLVRRSMNSYQDATWLRHIPAQKAVTVCRTSTVTKPVRVHRISPVPHTHTVSRGS